MRQFVISEERLKQLLKHERELCYANAYSVFYRPSEKELEVTENDLKPFTEIKEHEYVPDIDFDSTGDKKTVTVTVEVVGVVKHKPDFSVLNND